MGADIEDWESADEVVVALTDGEVARYVESMIAEAVDGLRDVDGAGRLTHRTVASVELSALRPCPEHGWPSLRVTVLATYAMATCTACVADVFAGRRAGFWMHSTDSQDGEWVALGTSGIATFSPGGSDGAEKAVGAS